NERAESYLRRVEQRLSLRVIEQSRYALRMILLLHVHSPASLTWLVRHIPTSPNTVVRCAQLLETSGLIASWREESGRSRHLFTLTRLGETVAGRAPAVWAEEGLLKP